MKNKLSMKWLPHETISVSREFYEMVRKEIQKITKVCDESEMMWQSENHNSESTDLCG